jgi:hypothetical protein
MIKAGNSSNNFALGTFAGPRCAEEKEGFVNHDLRKCAGIRPLCNLSGASKRGLPLVLSNGWKLRYKSEVPHLLIGILLLALGCILQLLPLKIFAPFGSYPIARREVLRVGLLIVAAMQIWAGVRDLSSN